MQTREQVAHAPVVAAFSPETAARAPVEFALAASRLTGARVTVVAVTRGPAHTLEPSTVARAGWPPALLELELELAVRGVPVELLHCKDSTPARGLARAIDALAPELIVLGSSSRGPRGSVLLGATAQRVINVSACPVALVPGGYRGPAAGIAVIGAAYTATPEGEQALRAAAALAHAGATRLRAIAVADREQARKELSGAITTIAGEAVEIEITPGEPASGLVRASRRLDLLVMGSRGLGPRRAVILGSVSRRVVDNAACPVLVIPRAAAARRVSRSLRSASSAPR